MRIYSERVRGTLYGGYNGGRWRSFVLLGQRTEDRAVSLFVCCLSVSS